MTHLALSGGSTNHSIGKPPAALLTEGVSATDSDSITHKMDKTNVEIEMKCDLKIDILSLKSGLEEVANLNGECNRSVKARTDLVVT
jgi:hypothetical protein